MAKDHLNIVQVVSGPFENSQNHALSFIVRFYSYIVISQLVRQIKCFLWGFFPFLCVMVAMLQLAT